MPGGNRRWLPGKTWLQFITPGPWMDAERAEYRAATGQDEHSVLVDFDSFVKVAMPDKSDPQRLYAPEDLDFRLRPGSVAVDAGVELPTITDGFSGKAPDLGAYELGADAPHYGPRTQPPGAPPPDAPRSIKGPMVYP